MNFFQKLQKLPNDKRKAIFWIIIVIIALCIFVFYIKSIKEHLKSFRTEEFIQELNLPKFDGK